MPDSMELLTLLAVHTYTSLFSYDKITKYDSKMQWEIFLSARIQSLDTLSPSC